MVELSRRAILGAGVLLPDVAWAAETSTRYSALRHHQSAAQFFARRRADRMGNIWSGSSAPLGYSGVTVWNPAGKLLGRIRLPEVCANVCFAGPKRDWLFMCATQSVYLLRVYIQGASPG
jgi:hypothetical protein